MYLILDIVCARYCFPIPKIIPCTRTTVKSVLIAFLELSVASSIDFIDIIEETIMVSYILFHTNIHITCTI